MKIYLLHTNKACIHECVTHHDEKIIDVSTCTHEQFKAFLD